MLTTLYNACWFKWNWHQKNLLRRIKFRLVNENYVWRRSNKKLGEVYEEWWHGFIMMETAQQSMSGIPVTSCLLLPTRPRRRGRNYTEQERRVPHVELLVELPVTGKIFSDRRKWEQDVRSAKVHSEYSVTEISRAEIRGLLYIVYLLLWIALHSKVLVL